MFRAILKQTFKKFVIGFIVLLIISIGLEVLFHFQLSSQKENSHIINIAGRQRMLSQRLVKFLFISRYEKKEIKEISSIIHELKSRHQEIKNYPSLNNTQIKKDLSYLDLKLNNLISHASCVQQDCPNLHHDEDMDTEAAIFLKEMDKLVFDMDNFFKDKVNNTIKIRWFLFLIMMFVILYEAIYVLKPSLKQIQLMISDVDRLKKIIENNAETIGQFAIIAKTDAKGNITYANDQFVSISGYEREELIGKNHRILNSGYHPPEFFKNMWDRINAGQTWRGTIKNISKFGFAYWVDTTIVPEFDNDGKIKGFTSLRYDISYIKEAENNQRRLYFTQQVISQIFALNSIKGDLNYKLSRALNIILEINWLAIKKQGAIFIVKDGKLHLETEKQLAPALITKCATVEFGTCLCGRAALKQEIIHAHCIDERHEITFEGIKEHGHYSVPFVQEGKTIGVMVLYIEHGHQQSMEEIESLQLIAQAISELISTENNKIELENQKKISQQNAKLASIGNLAAGVGHEINNPLAAIVGHIDVLKKKEEQDIQKIYERIAKIENATKRIVNIVQGLRTFSRKENQNEVDTDHTDFNLHNSIIESVGLLEDLYRSENVEIDFHFSPNFLSALCYGDANKFQQIIINLLSNAKDALEGRDNKKIFISGNVKDSHAVISVTDNGTGIPDELKEKIFDPFFTTKDPAKGTGIGLSLVYKLINEDYNGIISVENSKAHGGACFSITLPILYKEEIKIVSEIIEKNQSEEVSTSPQNTTPKVEKLADLHLKALLVDDEEDIRELISMILEDFDIEVTTAQDGKEALDIYTKNPDSFDVILSDMKMPVMDGPTFLTNLRLLDIKQPKFMFITGGINVDFENKNSKINQMLDGYLYKPFTDADIENALLDMFNYGKPKKSA